MTEPEPWGAQSAHPADVRAELLVEALRDILAVAERAVEGTWPHSSYTARDERDALAELLSAGIERERRLEAELAAAQDWRKVCARVVADELARAPVEGRDPLAAAALDALAGVGS